MLQLKERNETMKEGNVFLEMTGVIKNYGSHVPLMASCERNAIIGKSLYCMWITNYSNNGQTIVEFFEEGQR